jgi:hypothetical protein
MAQRIRTGSGAWVWDPAVVDWQGAEVELSDQGQLLRLDRLVRRRDTGDWWVLDFKSARQTRSCSQTWWPSCRLTGGWCRRSIRRSAYAPPS